MTTRQYIHHLAAGGEFINAEQAQILHGMLADDPEAMTTDGSQFFMTDGDDALHIIFASGLKAARIVTLAGFEARARKMMRR